MTAGDYLVNINKELCFIFCTSRTRPNMKIRSTTPVRNRQDHSKMLIYKLKIIQKIVQYAIQKQESKFNRETASLTSQHRTMKRFDVPGMEFLTSLAIS